MRSAFVGCRCMNCNRQFWDFDKGHVIERLTRCHRPLILVLPLLVRHRHRHMTTSTIGSSRGHKVRRLREPQKVRAEREQLWRSGARVAITNGLRSMRACPVEQFQQCRPPDGTVGVPMRCTGASFPRPCSRHRPPGRPVGGTALRLRRIEGWANARPPGARRPLRPATRQVQGADALIVRDTLPRNPSGKVLKHVLRRELAAI